MDQDEIAATMNRFQEMIAEDQWDSTCIDEAQSILNSYAKQRSRILIAQIQLGDMVSFAPNRSRGDFPSIVRGEVVEILRTRIRVREDGRTRKWLLPAWAVIDRFRPGLV